MYENAAVHEHASARAMPHRIRLGGAALFVTLGLALTMIVGLPAPAMASADPPVEITAAIPPRPVSSQGEVFLDKTVAFTTSDAQAVIASTADGAGEVYVDDEIDITVTHPDGTTSQFVRNYEFQPPSQPLDLRRRIEIV